MQALHMYNTYYGENTVADLDSCAKLNFLGPSHCVTLKTRVN